MTFVANPRYAKFLETTSATAAVVSLESDFNRIPTIKHEDPYYAFALILDELYPDEEPFFDGIDNTAVVAESAQIGSSSRVGALTYVGEKAVIGDRNVIYPGVYIGRRVKIGNGCKIFPGVEILDDTVIGDGVIIHSGTVIGSDGFGYARHRRGIKKVKQIGRVEIGDETEIGANVTIDRGALGLTVIGRHVKIDNLVQIAHNVVIGDYSIIISQTGISGSTRLGKGVILAGQVGLVGHIELGDGVQVGAKSGVNKDIPAGRSFFGYPAREIMRAKRIEACLAKLPELFRRVKDIEKSLKKD
jgi:UDP-3-O-[3-hydroxymyristoyl] glucosamine N-acyltransferase